MTKIASTADPNNLPIFSYQAAWLFGKQLANHFLGHCNFGHWDLFEIWYLVLGVFFFRGKQHVSENQF